MKNYLLVLSILSCIILAGCSVGYVTTLPPDVTYVRPVSPGPDYVWIGGDWVWTGGGYHWREGSWQHPREGYSWQSGHWENGGRGYRWHKGGWHR
jgi:WXXGXW repeat (2 copies)